MANALNIDLTGKIVVFDEEYLSVNPTKHPFLVTEGFGALPFTSGHALGGEFLSDGEKARMEGYMVKRLATEDEVRAVAPERADALREGGGA